jgi:protein-tyrosine phosphatase
MDARVVLFRVSETGDVVEEYIPLMTEVIPGLWVGGAAGTVLPENISDVVSLTGTLGYKIGHHLSSVLVTAWEDDQEQPLDQLDAIAAWVNSCAGPVLVHCGAGLNRSGVVAARALMLGGMTADEAITCIRTARHQSCLSNSHFEGWLHELGTVTGPL